VLVSPQALDYQGDSTHYALLTAFDSFTFVLYLGVHVVRPSRAHILKALSNLPGTSANYLSCPQPNRVSMPQVCGGGVGWGSRWVGVCVCVFLCVCVCVCVWCVRA
jgi:hypothetical protein